MFTARISIFAISGSSMEPTFSSGDSVVLRQEENVERGQIIFFRRPSTWEGSGDSRDMLVKRIAAIPGDTVSFTGKDFLVNGERFYTLPESYDCSNAPQNYSKMLTNTQIFVVGDNPERSVDSISTFCSGKVNQVFLQKRLVVDYGKVILDW